MIKKLDKWCDTDWIIFIYATGTIVSCFAAVFWDELSLGALAGIFSAAIMSFHVIEEWKFPGGLHYFYDILPDRKRRDLSRYPMSRLTDMITNVGLQWIPLLYALLACTTNLSKAVSLCIAMLCYGEMIAHTGGGILTYVWYREKGKKTIYHPGLATSSMMWLPAGLYISFHIGPVTGTDWHWGILLFTLLFLLCMAILETPLKKWVLRQEEGAFAFEEYKYYEKHRDQ